MSSPPALLLLRLKLVLTRLTARPVVFLVALVLAAFSLVALAGDDSPSSTVGRWAASVPQLGWGQPQPSHVGREAADVLQGSKQYDADGNELWNFPDRLRPDERYLISGMHSGWTNQVMIVVHAIHLAMLTGRTPLLPPFFADPNRLGPLVHDDFPDMAFQEIFDLPRLFDELRATPLGRHLRGIVDMEEVMEKDRMERAGGRGWPTPGTGKTGRDVAPSDRVRRSNDDDDDDRELDNGTDDDDAFGVAAELIDRVSETWTLGCWSPKNKNSHHSLGRFRLQPQFTKLPPAAIDKTSRAFLRWDGLQTALAADPDASIIDDALDRMPDDMRSDLRPSGWIACVDSLFYAVDSAAQGVWDSWLTPRLSPAELLVAPPVGPDAPGPWETVAQYMHWHPRLEERGRVVARRVLGVEEDAELPPFITVHIRHGDFLPTCRDKPGNTCFSLGAYAHAVAEMRQRLLDEQGVDAQRVLFTTNERDPAFLEGARKLGWSRVMDDEELRIRRDYGDWYPMLIDNVLLSMGAGIVGTAHSTMSMINARRIEYWHGGLYSSVMMNTTELALD